MVLRWIVLATVNFAVRQYTIRYENTRIADNKIDRLNFHFAESGHPYTHALESGCAFVNPHENALVNKAESIFDRMKWFVVFRTRID